MSVAHTSISDRIIIPPKIKIKETAIPGFTSTKLIVLLNAAPNFYQQVTTKQFFERYSSTLNLDREFTVVNGQLYIQLELMKGKNVIIQSGVEYTPKKLFDLIFSQIEKNKWQEFTKSFKNEIANFKLTSELRTKIQNIKDEYVEEITIKTKPLPYYVCFYCDLIKPRIIGDLLTRCLYMYPFGSVRNKSLPQSYQIDNIQYCLIEKHSISEINILITDEHGEQINFEDGLFITSLVLHFRKGI